MAHSTLIEHLTPYRDVVGHWLSVISAAFAAQGVGPTQLHAKALGLLEVTTSRQSAMLAFNHVFFILALLFVISFPLSFLLKSGRRKN
jgi:DHA2 family multidrug resistance protein